MERQKLLCIQVQSRCKGNDLTDQGTDHRRRHARYRVHLLRQDAQLYFDKNPETLANADLDDAEKLLGDITITAPDTVFDLPDGVTYAGATLSLKSETSLSLYFKSSKTLTFSVDGKTVETAKSGGYQIARIRGISAKELKNSFTLSVTAGESSGSVTYSPMNYCYNTLNGDTEDENLINVTKALYQYAQAADSYFD